MDVERWLRSLGLEQYEAAFRENDIDDTVLPGLTAEDLKDLGVGSVGHRRKLLDAIAALRAEASEPAPLSDDNPAIDKAVKDTAERRQVTVMFSDLVGSTALSARLDPEDLREVISAYQRCVAETVRRFGGFVARYMGDGVLIYFGYPAAHEDDAERAVRSGLAMIDAVAAVLAPEPLQVRIGVATGMVVVGDIVGSGEAQEHDIVGETPNLAARLQAISEPNMVVIAEATCNLLGNLFELRDLGPKELKGIADPVRAFAALRASSVESRFEAMHAGGLAALVGREEELELLLRRWARAKTGEGQMVLLSGEAGIGKSRLTAALMEGLAAEPHTRLRYFCSPQHTDSAFYPIIGQFERAAGFAHGDTPQTKLDKLDALLAQTSTSKQDAALFAEMLSLANDGRYPVQELAPEQRRQKTLEALELQLEILARSSPVLTIVEDAHWGDPTSLEAFGRTVERIRSLRVLMVVTFRPEFEAPWVGQSHVTALALNRLGHREAGSMIDRVVGNKTLPADVRKDIIERSDGIPLFVEEMTKAVLETGGELEAMQIAGAVPSPAHAVPASLHASLTARLDRLGATARQVSQAGAAIGREFGHDLLATIAGVPDDTLGSALQRLEDARLIHRRGVPPEATYSFRHALLRDAAYGMLLREPRRALHARIVEAILRLRPDTAEREPHLLAWHYTGAGLAGQAIMYWQQAGERNVAQYANREAIGYFQRALDLVETLPPGANRDRLEADLRLAQVVPLSAIHGAGSQAVEACAARVEELGDRLADWPGALAVRKVVWHTCLMRQPVPRALALGRELLSLAERSGDPAHIAIACRALGYSLYIAGEQGEADPVLARGIALADGLAAVYGEDPQIICRINRGMVLCFLGYSETALRIAHEGLARARARNNPHVVAWSLVSLADIHIFLRNAGRAEQAAAEAIDVARQHRLVQWLARAPQRRGWALCQLGGTHQGLALLEEGLGSQHATGHMLGTTRANYYLAEGCLLAGRPEAALGHIEAAHRHAETYGEHYMSAEIYRLHAEVLHIQGIPPPEIEGHLREALNIARDQGARLWELRAATFLARLWRDQGKVQQARELLAPVYGWFTEGFDTRDLKEAKALLDKLS